MQDMAFMKQWWRLGGVFGILFIVLFIIGAAFQGEEPPMYDDPVDEIRAFWVDNGSDYLTGDFIIGLAFVLFFLPFVATLSSLLGAAEGEPRIWSRLTFGGGILFLALGATAGIFWTTLAFGDVAETLSDEELVLLMSLDIGGSHFVPAGLVAMILPAAVVMLRTRVLPLWLGVLTLIVGVIAAISLLGIAADDPTDSVLSFVAYPVSAIWVLITSIVMLVKKEAPAAAEA
jgi:hypothetical protein